MLRTSIAVCIVALTATAAATAGNTGYLKGDPRVCAAGNQRYCAQYAAVATVRDYLAHQQHVAKYNGGAICKPFRGELLRWSCYLGLERKTALVTFKASTVGWRRLVTVR